MFASRRQAMKLSSTSAARHAQVERWWDELPRPRELRDLGTYRRGRDHRAELWDGGYTMLGSRRGRALLRLAADAEARNVPGALVDCGVWNGGSTVLLSLGAPGRVTWAFDSFQGLPQPGPLDGPDSLAQVGACEGSEEKVREAFARFAPEARLVVRAGWFEHTLPKAADEIAEVAVLHVDGDWYESVSLTLATFYPKLAPGGYVIVDDYGTWPGARRAVDEYRRKVRDRAPLVRVDHTGRYWRKPSRS